MSARDFKLSCCHVNMASKTDAPAMCELRSVIRFLEAEGWVMDIAVVSCRTLRRLRRTILTFGVVFIHDNVRPHSAIVPQQFLVQFKWDVSDHPAYSLDLATSDFHLFSELQNCLEGQSFQENEGIQSNV
ncbi:hypothetical protein AVEN_64938-1 [Araneus ventricosus]|uniref:Histone-lysine N-methyltransferase SETMAR n=1 Tax=Araneus ventricosus TaxID=182803 RepID=A0A4Y2PLM0_ARAVE|nr:hypothetical protein AVEN_64938-1 [Araneus ventricosus]